LPCYLREDKNFYFLVNNLSIRPDFFIEYYTKYPHVTTGRDFNDIMNMIYSMSLPKIVNKICNTKNPKEFAKLIKTLPPIFQEFFIEASLIAKDKDIKKNTNIREKILEYFKSYIKEVNGVWISTFLKEVEDKNILRCKDIGPSFEEWKDCDDTYNQLVDEIEIQRQQKLREENIYGIMGKYNPENGSFCIVDFQKEKQAKEKIAEKRSKGLTDKRVSYSGKVCGAGGWKLDELIEIAAIRLKLSPPDDFRQGESTNTLLSRINKESRLSNLISDKTDKEELRRILYWGTSKKEKGSRGIKQICIALRTWLEENNLLEIDNQCGVQGKKKIGKVIEEEKTSERVFRVETFIPSKDDVKFKAYIKDITKLMGECFGSDYKKYKPPIDDNTWIMVFSKKKLVGFIMVDKKNVLWNVCVAKNYRRQGIAKEAMKYATQFVCDLKGKTPSLFVDIRNKDYKKLVRMYNTFGFEVVKSDDRTIYMQHSCRSE